MTEIQTSFTSMGNTLVDDSLPQENLLKSIHENEISN